MEQQTLKITSVLSDPTRFSIYQYVTKRHGDVTVQEIADQFNIHANVARLHLTKLEDVNMVVSETKKTGKGGRPSRFYRLSDEVVSLQFPYRDYQRLAELCLETLAGFGDEGVEALKKIGYKFGMESAKTFLARINRNIEGINDEEKIRFIEQIALNQGLNPEISFNQEEKQVSFSIYNCTFKEAIREHSVPLCSMHYSLLLGIFEFFFGKVILKEEQSMKDEGCIACSYTTIIL
ncbi:helix-turn-helix transcriptional regulator [Alkalihalobacterium chitinilyticum]|uniref:Helix-turn-helix domain-containing protein n=1 Tax=Alkalihalobacterium chitinilyticum TaxID=2980103 RepID=A0ABT5VA03_9BACI|nr:helix-turn-helix domain-containing protein [Alkalihalobacterium chitinilyticum]MDE5412281.1 helix-turn-helix domain-containing protein [Alkalihalobacterium chitinilyticum]